MSIILRLQIFLCLILFAAFAPAQQAETSAHSAKQQVLWDKLESTIRAVDQNLDGVMGIAIEDLTTGQKYFLQVSSDIANLILRALCSHC